jgi:hypothetical protein
MILEHLLRRGVLRAEADDPDGGEGSGNPEVAAALAETKALNEEILRLRAENAEKDSGMRYWHEQAKKAGQPAPAAAATPAAEPDEEEDPIELLSKKGTKGLDELLAKRGFVRATDVDARIESKAKTIAAENALAAEYPDLQDKTSDFFKATAVHYRAMIELGVAPNLAMKFAADKADLEGYKSGKRTPGEKAEREARARAQGGDKTTREAAAAEESSELDPFQKYICEQLEITPESYKKRAKDGVVVTGGSK